MPATQPPSLPPTEEIERVESQRIQFKGRATEETVPPADSIDKVDPWVRTFTETSGEG